MQLYLIDILNGVIQNHIDIYMYMLLHTCLSVVKVLNALLRNGYSICQFLRISEALERRVLDN